MALGRLYGIGVGPGDPELLTRKAYRILQEVEVIFTPQGKKGRESQALTIIKELITENTTVIPLDLPMTQDQAILEKAWQEGASQIYKVLQTKDCAFVTIGDSLLYSTYGYLLQALQKKDKNIVIESVPGITSFSAAASRLNVTLAEGKEPLVIIPALGETEELRTYIESFPNLVLLKAASSFDEIYKILEDEGRLSSSYFISRCGMAEEHIEKDLSKLQGKKLDYLSLLLVKKEAKA
ncbi:precorrin-2 C(20)-methyltransferase [Heliorestis acidaminivorans]|uniref:Precorrin-2 C(20)-methyltransferase n=1 Tax=Heliorestis acidaminivorans TaxID=553427 RepID=A0A6I0F363_9FIRM|nr:precorrin-2 C(20)-methyltransferase [Heliorestis acidaminivorans]KAB2954180.1 precorrin-2 C(20)-methyltransferase [Heliorestis acidaminivorans]